MRRDRPHRLHWTLRSFRRLPLCSLLAVPLVVATAASGLSGIETDRTGGAAPAPADEVATDALRGIWWRYEQGTTGEAIRFWYFHGDGSGLYRYGKVGLTNTHSFDYTLDGQTLELRFRKTGEAHTLRFAVSEPDADGRDWLTLQGDPRELGTTRYYRLPGDRGPRAHLGEADAESGPPPAGHMWIDLQRFATGGQGFSFYQLRPAGIDGRGVGWHHRGDFDDWSTESLTYRIVSDDDGRGGQLELSFDLAGTTERTRYRIEGQGKERAMVLESDPRDFWLHHRYRDAGRSFGSAELSPLGLAPVAWQSTAR